MSDTRKPQSPPQREEPDLDAIYRRMRRLAFRLLGTRSDAEDVVQVAMESFLKARQSFRGEGSIEAFADGIVANVARNWMRRQRRGILAREVVADREDWPDRTAGPAEEAENRDRLRRLAEILRRLKPKYRMAYLLYHVEGKTVGEIARIEETSESAVRTRILRARREIQRRAKRDPVLSEWLDAVGGGTRP
jgi:RNA polymerase sigma-70 factor (ECF subfamily)